MVFGGNVGNCGVGHTRLKSVTVPTGTNWKRCRDFAEPAIPGRLHNRDPTPSAPRPFRKARRLAELAAVILADCVCRFITISLYCCLCLSLRRKTRAFTDYLPMRLRPRNPPTFRKNA